MPDDIRVSVIEAISELIPGLDSVRFLQISVTITILTALGCAFALVGVTGQLNNDSKHAFSPDRFKFNTQTFYSETSDILVLTLLECLIFPIVAFLAVRSTRQILSDHDEHRTTSSEITSRPIVSCLKKTSAVIGTVLPCYLCDCSRCFHSSKHNLPDEERPSVLSYHLLGDMSMKDVGANEADDESAAMINVAPLEGYEFEINRKKQDKANIDEAYLDVRKTVDYQKSLWLGFLFMLSTTVQVYIGLKCISFEYKNETKQGALMGLGVAWANIITWLLRELIFRAGSEEGLLIPTLHPHRLHLHQTLDSHYCDLCGQPIKDSRAFRCKLCDFDLCMICYAKKDAHTLEGQLRGDRGVRKDEHLSQQAYFGKAMTLIKEEWMIFSIALLALCCNNGISLWTPNLQGTILNTVVEGDVSSFNYWIKIYLFASIVTGLVGGIQSLCFNVVGRKLANTVRKRLYKGIIVQDIAFFDGNSSGQLTSRLTNDVGFMVSPIQSMLGTLVSNTILLIGGVLLCFITSWRLSMLAFTTVGPIIHITQVYASWSRMLNRRIYGALGVANGYATEALGNIRTVKAFANEHQEEAKYDEANDNALLRGIQDAFGGAGMYTINSYLELGAGVLILWYGGKMAVDGQDSMSPGKLITYQLYWNMLNNAYKSLLDIVTSFTRASGAAQRVFALLDSLPDIDIDKGKPVPYGSMQGAIRIEYVAFYYQMRPSHKVLNNINLNIPAGTTCALVGKSGGGKSTLVSLLMRFYDPKEGQIFFDGVPLSELCLRDVRRNIGIVQQNTELFGGTIEENITYGLEPGSWTREEVIEAAKSACAHDFIKQFPEGYLTRVGERGVRISGGQKQRISIARVFLRRPKILLLDEATSALDAESEAAVQEALDKLMRDSSYGDNSSNGSRSSRSASNSSCTIILVAHRLSTVINAHQIAVVQDGQLVEVGNHDTLINKPNGAYARLVAKQLKKASSIIDADRAALEDPNSPKVLSKPVTPTVSLAASGAQPGEDDDEDSDGDEETS